MFGIWPGFAPPVLAAAMNAAVFATLGKPPKPAPLAVTVAPLAIAVRVSLVLSNWRPAPAPLICTLPLATRLTVKLPPVAGGLIVGAPVTLMVVVFPLSAVATAGANTEATRNIALADRAASLDRFTWLSLSG